MSRRAPEPWEWCELCETDLRDWDHTITAGVPCPNLQHKIDRAHWEAVRDFCGYCGHQSERWWDHAPTCQAMVELEAQRAARRALEPHEPSRWPFHWPCRALVESGPWRAFIAAAVSEGAHGSELANALPDSADADKLLGWAEETGQLERGGETPTTSQMLLNQGPRLAWCWWSRAQEPMRQ